MFKELTPTGERADGSSGMIVNENGRVPRAPQIFAHYEAIFYSFYNKELTIDDTDMGAALQDCYQLLQISDYLGSTGLISKPIEVALVKHGQDLFRAIRGAPHAWVDMSYRIRSEVIFKECMIHLVGNWKTLKLKPTVIDSLREVPGIRALIEKYHRGLLQQCKNLELGIMSLYPGDMRLPVDDLPIKREAYSKDILVWMALTFFRHWIGQRLIMEKGRHSPDCGYELYKQIGMAGEAYMDKSVINQFHTKFPMTKKAMNVLENHLLEIKECMKGVVDQHKILKSNCQLDGTRYPSTYLTCTDFKRTDFPWLKEDEEAGAGQVLVAPAKRQYKPGGNEISRQNLATARRQQERSLSLSVDGDMDDDADDFEDNEDEDEDDDVPDPRRKRARVG
jgi:hypothetical protein